MSTSTILDRLKLCNEEVSGVTTALRLQPTKPISPAALPLVYVRPLGMSDDTSRSSGQYVVPRRYQIVCLVGLSQGATLDYGEEGSALLAAVMPFLDAFTDYYMGHPHLNTATLGDLDRIESDVKIIDAGPEIFKAVDGQEYAGVRPIITIAERRIPSPKRGS
jgi:hypothetical protein